MVSRKPGQPGRYARLGVTLALLQFAERAHVLEDAVEIILAANGAIGLRGCGVERHAQLVEVGLDQRAAVTLVEHGAVGIEQHIGAAILEVAHHARQIFHQHGFADAVQYRAMQARNLIDDRGEQLPAHVGRRLELRVGARAGRAQKIAAVGRFQIKADRLMLGHVAAGIDALEVALGIDSPLCCRRCHYVFARWFVSRRAGQARNCSTCIDPSMRRLKSRCRRRSLSNAAVCLAWWSCCPSRRCRSDFGSAQLVLQSAQALGIVDIVPHRQPVNLKPDLAGALERLLGDALRAPCDIFEQTPMCGLDAEQIIAAVARRAEHGAVARPRQRLRGFASSAVGSVGLSELSTTAERWPRAKISLDGVQQAIAEIRQPGLDQADRRRQSAAEKILAARRTEGGIAGNAGIGRGVARGEQHVVGDVLQKRGVEGRGFVECQRRHQPGLGPARRGGFGHESDAATRRICRFKSRIGHAICGRRLAVRSVRAIHPTCPR